jgi:hypothetical protein
MRFFSFSKTKRLGEYFYLITQTKIWDVRSIVFWEITLRNFTDRVKDYMKTEAVGSSETFISMKLRNYITSCSSCRNGNIGIRENVQPHNKQDTTQQELVTSTDILTTVR